MDAARRIGCLDRLQRVQNWKRLMRIIWCPRGRNLWFDLALKMQKENLAEFGGIFNTLKKVLLQQDIANNQKQKWTENK
jgi:hypothetical protein